MLHHFYVPFFFVKFCSTLKLILDLPLKATIMHHVHRNRNPQSCPRVHGNLENNLRLYGKHFIRYISEQFDQTRKQRRYIRCNQMGVQNCTLFKCHKWSLAVCIGPYFENIAHETTLLVKTKR